MSTTTTTTTTNPYAESVAATLRTREGADLWSIADALLAEVGPGEARSKFDGVRRACSEAGVRPYSVSALRQYRDVAARWTPADRLPGVSFSAHRAALPAENPGELLRDLVAVHGANVTVKQVNEAALLAAGGVLSLPAAKTVDLRSIGAGGLTGELVRRWRTDPVALVRDLSGKPGSDVLRDISDAVAKASAGTAAKAGAWSGTSGGKASAKASPVRPATASAGTAAKASPVPVGKRRGLRG